MIGQDETNFTASRPAALAFVYTVPVRRPAWMTSIAPFPASVVLCGTESMPSASKLGSEGYAMYDDDEGSDKLAVDPRQTLKHFPNHLPSRTSSYPPCP